MRIKKISTPYLIIIAALIIVISISAVIAYMFRQTGEVKNEFIPAEVKCEITETFEDDLKTSVKVKNTGNIDAYIRLRVVSYWEDSKGNVVARDMNPPAVTYDIGKWKKDLIDNYTYYYTGKVAPGDLTPEFLTNSITMDPVVEEVNGTDYTYYPVMEVLAEAIQADGKNVDKPAVTDAWGVTITDGVITAVN